MENGKEKNEWMSVPQFGGWDQKAGVATDYSMVFSRARANRKQHKTELNRRSLGNEQELLAKQQTDDSVVGVLDSLNICFSACVLVAGAGPNQAL
ncbi:unnamed protein product [Ilex paraguariensis]|uniref:RIN4 pathogenic type III effector avirulence factor Avr cleavage site domain-containing protein n=1 Tax=Ilex paraguariensis TaxID=185542 RepID=A0ABC8R255_9AQUA